MARSSALNAVRFLGIAAAVVMGGLAVGYLIGGRPSAPSTNAVVISPETPAAPSAAPVPPPVVRPVAPRNKSADFSAPGAPRIKIVEEKTPVLTDTSGVSHLSARRHLDQNGDIPTPDAEASQEKGYPPSSPVSTASDGGSATSSSTDTSNPASPPTVAADSGQAGGHSDSEANQEGDSRAGSGRPQFRVQTGTFMAAENARALADALRDRGYTTSTRSEQQGDKTVYKVQIGAYRTRAAADKAALDLQKSGYPAYVSPITP